MIKNVTHAHLGPIWYYSEPSDIPYSSNHFLGWYFFCCFLHQDGSILRAVRSSFIISLGVVINSIVLKTILYSWTYSLIWITVWHYAANNTSRGHLWWCQAQCDISNHFVSSILNLDGFFYVISLHFLASENCHKQAY